jgi:hypothetical protein
MQQHSFDDKVHVQRGHPIFLSVYYSQLRTAVTEQYYLTIYTFHIFPSMALNPATTLITQHDTVWSVRQSLLFLSNTLLWTALVSASAVRRMLCSISSEPLQCMGMQEEEANVSLANARTGYA